MCQASKEGEGVRSGKSTVGAKVASDGYILGTEDDTKTLFQLAAISLLT